MIWEKTYTRILRPEGWDPLHSSECKRVIGWEPASRKTTIIMCERNWPDAIHMGCDIPDRFKGKDLCKFTPTYEVNDAAPVIGKIGKRRPLSAIVVSTN